MAAATDSVSYQLVYDVRHALPSAWGLIFISLVLGTAGFILYRQAHRFESSKPGFVAMFLMVFAGLVALFWLGASIGPYAGLRLAVLRGRYRIVEGTVHSFVPGDPGDHRAESWVLETPSGRMQYSYSPSVLEGGYTQTAPHGGLVAEGKRVRVMDVHGRIARLEIVP